MLVIISDLHFTDGTTSNHSENPKTDLFNVNPNAFKMFFSRIADIAQKTNLKTPGSIKEVKFIYNGDIFDPLRSTQWFEDGETQPWNQLPPNANSVTATVVKILDAIIATNEEAFKWLRGYPDYWKAVWEDVAGDAKNVTVERIYIPGNHDRMLNLDPATRGKVRETLLGTTGNEQFSHYFADKYDTEQKTGYGAIVMHGHEADPNNLESNSNGPLYDEMPIGDPMTTMIFAKIGYDLSNPTLQLKDTAKARFREIDNVRPASAVGEFIKDAVEDFDIHGAVNGVLDKIVDNFQNLPFYINWIKKHDTWHPFDSTEKLEVLLASLKRLSPALLAWSMNKLKDILDSDPCSDYALQLLKTKPEYLFCVMGHTHDPAHVPLFIGSDRRERHYFNSGTFREVFTKSLDEKDFIRHQRMSYVVIYGPGEFDGKNTDPVYEMWNGLRARN